MSVELNDDFRDMLACLAESEVAFVVVGAHALSAHGIVRATGDIDILVRPDPANAERVMQALARFGAPMEAHGVKTEDFARPGNVYQLGLPPRRIDLLTSIDGVTFDEAVRGQLSAQVGSLVIPFIGREALIKNKRAAGRPKDLLDVADLERAPAG